MGWHRFSQQKGQASVEFVGALPIIIVVLLVAWQLVLAGQAAWLTANAARVAARAAAVGKDAEGAARSALPTRLEDGLEVKEEKSGATGRRVDVKVRVPLLINRWKLPFRVGASAQMQGSG